MSDIPTDHPEQVDLSDDTRAANAESLPVTAKGRPKASDDIPEPIYRLKTLHSSETSFGYYVHLGADWPHFRSRAELELLLEGPIAQQAMAA